MCEGIRLLILTGEDFCGEGPRLNMPGAGELRWSVLLGVQGHDMAMSLSLGDAESGTPSCSMRLLYAPSTTTPLHHPNKKTTNPAPQ